MNESELPRTNFTSFLTLPIVLAFVVAVSQMLPVFAEEQKSKPAPANTSAKTTFPLFWPPKLNVYYPNLKLLDQDGKRAELSQFKGKVIVIEPIGISCPACQAFSGAHKVGPLRGVSPQGGLQSFEEYMKQYTGSTLDNPKIVFVQLLLYNMGMEAPSLAEGQEWARHFQMTTARNRYVLVGEKNMIGNASYNMIPGFQVVDQNFVLRSDSTGHNPTNDLYRHFFPTLKSLL